VNVQYGYVFRLNTWYDWLFLLFPFIALLSLVFAPASIRSPVFLVDMKIWIQYVYWMVLVLFIKTHGIRINWKLSLKFIFWGVNFLIICFYFVHFKVSFLFVNLTFSISRNAFIFQLLCLVPLCLFYIRFRYGSPLFYVFAMAYLIIVLFSEGRAGSIIIMIEILLLVYLINKTIQSFLKFLLIPIIVLSAYVYFNYTPSQNSVNSVADFVGDYNPRLALLIKGEGQGDLTFDKSWLLRELMIEKSKGIVKDYPFFGVGLHHFNDYDFDFSKHLDQNNQFKRLSYRSDDFYNSRSTHNSYFQILAETGFIGFIVILFIIFIPIITLLIRLVRRPSLLLIFCIGLLGISIHYYVISSISGAISWFTLGIAYFFLDYESRISLPRST
jgi:O-antigen ligase